MIDQRLFAEIFRLNIERRSRTAKGQDKGSETSASKKPLRLQGEDLARKVRENTERLIADVASAPRPGPLELSGMHIRGRCERWFDIVNDGLYGPDAYAEEFAKLQEHAARLRRIPGMERLRLNPRYRFWTPAYTTVQVAPVLLEAAMDDFYGRLALLVGLNPDPAFVMAYADVMMDGELHPWMDGCGRVSTALVMWIALAMGCPAAPLFAETKAAHYLSIRDIDAHAAYLLQALIRGARHAP